MLTCIYPQENVYNPKTDTIGKFRHLLVTVEQLFKDPSGHFSKLGRLIRNNKYQKHILRVNVDEAHHIRTAGEALYDVKALSFLQVDAIQAVLVKFRRFLSENCVLGTSQMGVKKKQCIVNNERYMDGT